MGSGIFDGANEAALTGNNLPFITEYPGRYLLKIDNARTGVMQGPKTKGKAFAALDVEVVKSNNPLVAVGFKASWLTTKSFQYPEFFWTEIKTAIAATMRVLNPAGEPDALRINQASMDKAFSDAQPMKGKLVVADCYPETKKGQTFNKARFSPGDATSEVGAMQAQAQAPAAGGTSTGGGGYAPTTPSDEDVPF
jgi:hypothetical protein